MKFLIIVNWKNNNLAKFISGKNVYINSDVFYQYKEHNGAIFWAICCELSCPEHKEADSTIVYVCNIVSESDFRFSDTDILIILLGNMDQLKGKIKMWI